MTLFLLLVIFCVLCVAYWAVHHIGKAAGIPAPAMAFVDVILVVVFLICVLDFAGVQVPGLP